MPRSRLAAVLVVVAGLTTACGGGSDPAPATDSERDCGAVITAARGIKLYDPRAITEEQVSSVVAAAERLRSAADAATTAVADPAADLADTAEDYARALVDGREQRATTRQGVLRQQAEPVAKACGESASRILGATV